MFGRTLKVWMDPIEFSQLVAAIESVRPRRYLEWGSGGSTQAVLERCPFIEEYIAVEHNGAWVETVRKKVRDPRLQLFHIPPDNPLPPGPHPEAVQTEWDEAAEFDRPRLATYIDFPKTLDKTFDFILIGGRARRFCVEAGFSLLRSGGVLCVHDAQRSEYHDVIRAQGRAVFLQPWKQGQICLLRKP